MKTVRVTNNTLRAIADLAILPFRSNATQQDNGTWLLPIDDEVWQRIEDKQLPHERHDDTLIRIIREYWGSSRTDGISVFAETSSCEVTLLREQRAACFPAKLAMYWTWHLW